MKNPDPTDLAMLLAKCEGLYRGCDCEYDYRCGNCQRIIDVKEIAARIVQDMQLDAQPKGCKSCGAACAPEDPCMCWSIWPG